MMGSRRTMLLMNGMYVPFGALMLVMYDKEYFHLYRIYTDSLCVYNITTCWRMTKEGEENLETITYPKLMSSLNSHSHIHIFAS